MRMNVSGSARKVFCYLSGRTTDYTLVNLNIMGFFIIIILLFYIVIFHKWMELIFMQTKIFL